MERQNSHHACCKAPVFSKDLGFSSRTVSSPELSMVIKTIPVVLEHILLHYLYIKAAMYLSLFFSMFFILGGGRSW